MTRSNRAKHFIASPSCTLVLAVFCASTAAADVIHVDAGAPGGGDGTTWATAFATVGGALDAARAGDELWIAAGTYLPGVALRSGVALYGGFSGQESSRDERSWIENDTILGRVLGTDIDDAILDGISPGQVDVVGSQVEVANCLFDGLTTSDRGAAIFAEDGGSLVVRSCLFTNNQSRIGGAIYARNLQAVALIDTDFIGNFGIDATGAAVIVQTESIVVVGCTFDSNNGGFAGPGGLAIGLPPSAATIIDCRFINNTTNGVVGGIGAACPLTMVNCVVSRNTADQGGGLLAARETTLINCTISGNNGDGVYVDTGGSTTLVNSIVWGNVPEQFTGLSGDITATFSNIQGGWPGSGNIDADPLFVQPGTGDVRLGIGSPCIDAGDSSAVPPDVPTDLAGNPRIQGAAVDMGAFEGEFELAPPSSLTEDLDPGEVVFLVPDGVGYDPVSFATVVARNVTGPPDAMMAATLYEADVHPDARGFSEITDVLVLDTTLDDGAFWATVSIPFDETDLGGADPLDAQLTAYDAASGNWTLAVTADTVDSPGHPRRFGDRIVVVSSDPGGVFGITTEVGDYGVFWNPDDARGLVWATVDHAGEFGVGGPLCPVDAYQPPNGFIGMEDLLLVISAWGAESGPFDVNGDGIVDAVDVFEVVARWGTCAE